LNEHCLIRTASMCVKSEIVPIVGMKKKDGAGATCQGTRPVVEAVDGLRRKLEFVLFLF
jgi:hypothetical protein